MGSSPIINVTIIIIARTQGMSVSSGLGKVTTRENDSTKGTYPSGLGEEEQGLGMGRSWLCPTDLSSDYYCKYKESWYNFTHFSRHFMSKT